MELYQGARQWMWTRSSLCRVRQSVGDPVPVGETFSPPRPMPVVRIFLESLAHSGKPSGAFNTFVSVSDDELASGNHLRAAMRRAGVRGFEAPYRVIEVRPLEFALLAEGKPRPRRERRRADGALTEESAAEALRGAA